MSEGGEVLPKSTEAPTIISEGGVGNVDGALDNDRHRIPKKKKSTHRAWEARKRTSFVPTQLPLEGPTQALLCRIVHGSCLHYHPFLMPNMQQTMVTDAAFPPYLSSRVARQENIK